MRGPNGARKIFGQSYREKTDNIETTYPWLREEKTRQVQDDHPFFDEWQAIMEEWEAATSKALNIAYGTEQVVKATPELKTISAKKHMERNWPKKRLTQGAWEWILRRLGEIKARFNAPTQARHKLAARTADKLKAFLGEGLIRNDHVVGLLETLGQFTERRVGVSLAEVEGWMVISRFHIKGLCAEDRKAKPKHGKKKLPANLRREQPGHTG